MRLGEQRSRPEWLLLTGDSKEPACATVVGNATPLLSWENCHAKSFCNFVSEKLSGKDELSYNIFQMRLHWLWGKDGRKRITVLVFNEK